MIRRISVITILLLIVLQGTAFSLDTHGEVIFRDSLYGAAIGGLIGATVYLIDQDDAFGKIGAGILIGTLGGLVYGLNETRSFVEIEKNEIKIAVPTPVIQKRNDGIQYSASLFKTKF
ncbi:MAG: hypothetical protein KAJ59_01220 [Thermodesulfovibrionia bacterium]|nr:hypothetical protein [Thermodesulfovibrionia bacterium]